MNISEIKFRLNEIEQQKVSLLHELNVVRSNQKFKCICGKLHKIKDCHALECFKYINSSGYEDGYWNFSYIGMICKDSDVKNRFLFPSIYDVAYGVRDRIQFNAEEQFKRNYLRLFKTVTIDNDSDKTPWANNTYFDNNHKKFEIELKV